jgi:hypothetical protein
VELSRVFNSKKFMWDGKARASKSEAETVAQEYRRDGFEVEMVEIGGEVYLFSRRAVKEIVVEGAPV